jgi:hypothetical protein
MLDVKIVRGILANGRSALFAPSHKSDAIVDCTPYPRACKVVTSEPRLRKPLEDATNER